MNYTIISFNPLYGVSYYCCLNVNGCYSDYNNYKWVEDKKEATLLKRNKAINILNCIGNPNYRNCTERYVYNFEHKKIAYVWKNNN